MGKKGLPIWGLLFSIALCLGISCGIEPPKDNKLDKVAQVFCECTDNLIALNKKMLSAPDDTSSSDVDFQALEVENAKSQECMTSIVAKYGKLNSTEIAQLKDLLRAKCPELKDMNAEQTDNIVKEMLGE